MFSEEKRLVGSSGSQETKEENMGAPVQEMGGPGLQGQREEGVDLRNFASENRLILVSDWLWW